MMALGGSAPREGVWDAIIAHAKLRRLLIVLVGWERFDVSSLLGGHSTLLARAFPLIGNQQLASLARMKTAV